MSLYFRVTRQRWAAREMVVRTWFKQPGERAVYDEPICELAIDGAPLVVSHRQYGNPMVIPPSQFQRLAEFWGIYRHFMNAGDEVGPWGELFEYSEDSVTIVPQSHPGAPHRFNYRRRESYPPIFLNYRRNDSEAYAGRLHEALGHEFGTEGVFMDQFSIRGGEVGPWTIQQAVAHCRVVVALIGPGYLTAEPTRNAFDLLRDYVIREITAALDRGTTIIPVLLPGATVTSVTKVLPEEMGGLEQFQMLELSVRHWQQDVSVVIEAIKQEIG